MNNKKKNRVDIITTPTKLHQLRAELQKYKSQLEKKKSEGKERETDRINRNIAKTELRIKERKEKLLQLLAQDSNQNTIEIERELDSGTENTSNPPSEVTIQQTPEKTVVSYKRKSIESFEHFINSEMIRTPPPKNKKPNDPKDEEVIIITDESLLGAQSLPITTSAATTG